MGFFPKEKYKFQLDLNVKIKKPKIKQLWNYYKEIVGYPKHENHKEKIDTFFSFLGIHNQSDTVVGIKI